MTPIVYALTTNFHDKHYAMLRLSVASLHLFMPTCPVVIALDSETFDIYKKRKPSPSIDNCKWIEVATPKGSNEFRNRCVKSSLRMYLQGPFLYLDCDTLVRSAFDIVVDESVDIAGVENHHGSTVCPRIEQVDLKIIQGVGQSTDFNIYLNGGVIYCRDSEDVHALFSEWNQRLVEAYQKLNSSKDQALLNISIRQAKAKVGLLDSRLNAQVYANTRSLDSAWIWHFFGNDVFGVTEFERYASVLLDGTASIDLRKLQLICQSAKPWRVGNLADKFIVWKMERCGFAHPIYLSLLQRNWRLFMGFFPRRRIFTFLSRER